MKLSRHTNSIIIITMFIVFIISGTRTLQSAEARQQLTNEVPPQLGSPASNIPLSNFTGSISLTASLFEVLKSKTNVSLADAMTDVTTSMGQNATILSGSVQTERGFLVYRIVGLDDSNNINMVLIDPANGSILSQRQWPAVMSQVLSSIPGVGTELSNVLAKAQQDQNNNTTTATDSTKMRNNSIIPQAQDINELNLELIKICAASPNVECDNNMTNIHNDCIAYPEYVATHISSCDDSRLISYMIARGLLE
jgi:hypothetical protein